MSQRKRILNFLMDGKILTRINSWDLLGVIEAPARISELRGEGWPINTKMVTVTNRFGEKVKIAQWTMDLSELP